MTDMIDTSKLTVYPYRYPILRSSSLLDATFYNRLKSAWPDFKKFKTTSAGQRSRENIEIKKGNKNYKTLDDSFSELYDKLDSNEFRSFLKSSLCMDDKKSEGYIGDFDSSELILHVAESTDGYENPWHSDTRQRIVHFLIYFGTDMIESGGELAIAEHTVLDSHTDYKQYPRDIDLSNIKYFEPEDNLGIFILSQNNSYHKGCRLKGLRRFIYGGYTNKKGTAWISPTWSCNKNFTQQLESASESS